MGPLKTPAMIGACVESREVARICALPVPPNDLAHTASRTATLPQPPVAPPPPLLDEPPLPPPPLAVLLEEPEPTQKQAPKERPSAWQICAPIRPSMQAHAADAPGTQVAPPVV